MRNYNIIKHHLFMKNTLIILLLLTMTLSIVSCGNNGTNATRQEQTENMKADEEEEAPSGMFTYEESYRPQFKYEIILDPTKTEMMGVKVNPFSAYHGELAIKEEHPVFGEQYIFFDDEMNYNDYLREWMLASYLSIIMVDYYSSDWENNKHKVEHALSLVGDLPNTANIEDSEIAENFKKAYYDLKSLTVYMPEEKYGFKVFPLGELGAGIRILRQNGLILTYHYATLYRISDKEGMGIEDGVLGVHLQEKSSIEVLELFGL